MAMSSDIEQNIESSGIPKTQITKLALPPGLHRPWKFVLEYISAVGKAGHSDFSKKDFATPLFTYYHAVELLNDLKIKPLADNVRARYTTLSTYTPGKYYDMTPTDVRTIYKSHHPDHPLRVLLARNLAQAYLKGDLKNEHYRSLEALKDEVTDFWDE